MKYGRRQIAAQLLQFHGFIYIYIYDSNYNNNNTVFTYKQYIGYSCNVWWGLFVTV